MISIDSSRMYCAISSASESVGLPEDKGFLHRSTGKIVFVYEDEGDAELMMDRDAAVEGVFDRGHIEAFPDQWLEIPKYDSRVEGHYNEDAFIHSFLTKHGIEAKLE